MTQREFRSAVADPMQAVERECQRRGIKTIVMSYNTETDTYMLSVDGANFITGRNLDELFKALFQQP